MLKINFHDASRISTRELRLYFSLLPKLKFNVYKKNYSTTSEKIKPVKLAYSSYESTGVEQYGNNNNYPLIIMHGLLGSKNNWNSLSKTIHARTQRKVIAIDARNHGDSPQTVEFNYPCLVEDIRCLMEDLNISKINALGHSLGGRSMMFFALKYPHLINSLIVVDISPIKTSAAIIDLANLIDAMLSIKFKNNIPLSTARNIVNQQLMDAIPEDYVRQFVLTNMIEVEGAQYKWRVNLESLSKNFHSIADFKPPAGKYKGPTLFVGGGKSTFLTEDDHENILQLFPKAEFKYIKDAGHWVHSEKPAEFLNLVCNFLNKI